MVKEHLSREELEDIKNEFGKWMGLSLNKIASDEVFVLSSMSILLAEICDELKQIRVLLEKESK